MNEEPRLSSVELRHIKPLVINEEKKFIQWQADRHMKIAEHLGNYVSQKWIAMREPTIAAGFLDPERPDREGMDAEAREVYERTCGLHAMCEVVPWLTHVRWSPRSQFVRERVSGAPDTKRARIDIFAEKMAYIIPVGIDTRYDGQFQISQKGLDLINECRALLGSGPDEPEIADIKFRRSFTGIRRERPAL